MAPWRRANVEGPNQSVDRTAPTKAATLNSQGYNFSDDSTCNLASTGDRQVAGNPALGALAHNGGPTQTQLPATGRPRIDWIPDGACQTSPLATGITTTSAASLVRA